MTVMSDIEILNAMLTGEIGMPNGWDPGHIQPASYDIHLDDELLESTMSNELDPRDASRIPYITRQLPYPLLPGQLYLGSSIESFKLPPSIGARVDGKSSLGRMGLLTHITAGFIDPGFCGTITLELLNVARTQMRLVPGLAVAQVSFFRLGAPAQRPYGHPDRDSHYQWQNTVTPACDVKTLKD